MVKHGPTVGERSYLISWLHITCSPRCLLWQTPIIHIAEVHSLSLGDVLQQKSRARRGLWWTSICSYASLILCHFLFPGCLMQNFGTDRLIMVAICTSENMNLNIHCEIISYSQTCKHVTNFINKRYKSRRIVELSCYYQWMWTRTQNAPLMLRARKVSIWT